MHNSVLQTLRSYLFTHPSFPRPHFFSFSFCSSSSIWYCLPHLFGSPAESSRTVSSSCWEGLLSSRYLVKEEVNHRQLLFHRIFRLASSASYASSDVEAILSWKHKTKESALNITVSYNVMLRYLGVKYHIFGLISCLLLQCMRQTLRRNLPRDYDLTNLGLGNHKSPLLVNVFSVDTANINTAIYGPQPRRPLTPQADDSRISSSPYVTYLTLEPSCIFTFRSLCLACEQSNKKHVTCSRDAA
jgi:hypothetical protein